MDEFAGLPVHAQNALKRAGIASTEQARSLGREALSQVPGLGPLAIARLFPSAEPQQRRHVVSSDELRRAKGWFEALRETDPTRLTDEDHVLAEKLATWID